MGLLQIIGLILRSKSLFAKCMELAPAFNILLKRPTQLHLYPDEAYGITQRDNQNVAAPAFAVTDMPQMAHYVYQRALLVVEQMSRASAPPMLLAPPQGQTTSAAEGEEPVAQSADAGEADAEKADSDVLPPSVVTFTSAPVEQVPAVAEQVQDPPAMVVDTPVQAPVPTIEITPATLAKEDNAKTKTPRSKRTAEQSEEGDETPATPSSAGKVGSMTVTELKAALSAAGLDTKGLKKDLVQRYQAHLDAQ